MRDKRLKAFLSNLALLFFGVVLFFFVFEIFLRFTEPNPGAMYICDPLTGFKFAPNQKTRNVTPEFNVAIETNSAGFRDREWSVEKPPGAFRIAVLGDSFMSGLQVSREDLFTARLEKRLNAAGSNIKYEVLNFGLDGMGTAQEYEVLRHYALKYKPDLVILAFFADNDIRNNMPELNYHEYAFKHIPYYKLDGRGNLEYIPFKTPSAVKTGIRNFVKRNFRTATFITTRLRDNPRLEAFFVKTGLLTELLHKERKEPDAAPAILGLYEKRYGPVWKKGWRVTEKLIVEMKRRCGENGSKFFIMSIAQPALVAEGPAAYFREFPLKKGEWDFLKPNKLLGAFCRNERVDYVDLLYPFRRYYAAARKPLYFTENRHMNAGGMELAAEVVYGELAAKKIIPPAE